MPGYNLKHTLIIFGLIMLMAGCAQPAHKNTLPWNLTTAYTEVLIVAPDQYLVDGLFFSHDSFKQWLSHRAEAGLLLPILLKTSDEFNLFKRRNYFEMASIAVNAEHLGYDVYYSSVGVMHNETSAEALLAMADNQSITESEPEYEPIIINTN